MPMFDDCIIMAGGSGSRLWPASGGGKPKQFLSGPGGKSFLSLAIERGLGIINRERDGLLMIIGGKAHLPLIIDTCASLPDEDKRHIVVIPEPSARNTAPAIALGAVYNDWVFPEERTLLVLTSDHIIEPLETFRANAAAASAFARQNKLAVFGIPPLSPETGFGYIEAGESLALPQDLPAGSSHPDPQVFRLLRFREKPDRSTAEQFLATGTFYWNSGMFGFKVPFMLDEFQKYAPEILEPLKKLRAPDGASYDYPRGVRVLERWLNLDKAYQDVTAISFDYAIAEHCRDAVVLAADFTWRDIGSWDEYAKLLGEDRGEVYSAGSKDCFVDSDIPVALIGVEDLIVAIRAGKDGRPASALIAKKGETQRVREIVEILKQAGREDLL